MFGIPKKKIGASRRMKTLQFSQPFPNRVDVLADDVLRVFAGKLERSDEGNMDPGQCYLHRPTCPHMPHELTPHFLAQVA